MANEKIKKISKTKIEKKLRKKTNEQLRNLVILLKKQEGKWLLVAELLARPRRKSIKVNIDKINRLTKKDSIADVPGKVLGKGNIDHTITLAAFSFSKEAREKLKNCQLLDISQLVEKKPKNFKIIM